MDDYDETDTAHFRAMVCLGYEREIHCYGIADGMRRRAVDASYAHEPAYLEGHAVGMTLDEVPDDGED